MKGLEILIDLNEAHRFNEDLVSEPVYLATAAPYRSHFTERDSCSTWVLEARTDKTKPYDTSCLSAQSCLSVLISPLDNTETHSQYASNGDLKGRH